ncbi:MAG TPA: type II toxin-antitoxin system RelE/ParE family toxin [Terriglobia bacterium]|nr:type II toxin-antitoxin system RelE/ParE family toxin [Terriglobia bacterium]
MIASYADRNTEKQANGERVKRFEAIEKLARKKIAMLDAAEGLSDLSIFPGNHLEKLSGDRKGQFSIRINDQYRICSKWQEGACYEVEITDHH